MNNLLKLRPERNRRTRENSTTESKVGLRTAESEMGLYVQLL